MPSTRVTHNSLRSVVGAVVGTFVVCLMLTTTPVSSMYWQNAQFMAAGYRILWNVNGDEIVLEVQAETRGYFGLGFARPGDLFAGSDVVIGWVTNGTAFLQDRHFRTDGNPETFYDASQDYTLHFGYENRTHTVMRFSRPLSAVCDGAHDVAITADTQSMFYLLSNAEPDDNSTAPDAIPSPAAAISFLMPMQMLERTDTIVDPECSPSMAAWSPDSDPATHRADHSEAKESPMATTFNVDLRNGNVKLPMEGEMSTWCRVFDIGQFDRKHHIVQYEPLFDGEASHDLMQEIVVYECQGESERLRQLADRPGHLCHAQRVQPTLPCNAIVAAWRRGSTGLVLPPEAGIPLDSTKDRYLLMETMYSNVDGDATEASTSRSSAPIKTDDSGIRLHVTPELRPNDAGSLSLGIHPEWRHIIPPGHERVISEGHCVDDCTASTLPAAGINIFAVLPQTKHIATQVRLRHVRNTTDLLPIHTDANVHSAFSEYRAVRPATRVMPGDRLIVECAYDSRPRQSITLGGWSPVNELCQMVAVYWPRQRRLTECQSLVGLATVMQSLGIEEMMTSTTPVQIAKPAELAGMTLEMRLLKYDWVAEFGRFQRAMLGGTFAAYCTDARHKPVPKTDSIDYQRPSIHNHMLPPLKPPPPLRQCPAVAVESPAKPKRDKSTTTVVIDMGERRFDSLRLRSSTSSAAPSKLRTTIPLLQLIAVALFASSLGMYATAAAVGIRRTSALLC